MECCLAVLGLTLDLRLVAAARFADARLDARQEAGVAADTLGRVSLASRRQSDRARLWGILTVEFVAAQPVAPIPSSAQVVAQEGSVLRS